MTRCTLSSVKRTRDPDAKKAAILRAARTAFAERGYARATIRDIAQAYVDRMEQADGSDPFLALIRSAASEVTVTP